MATTTQFKELDCEEMPELCYSSEKILEVTDSEFYCTCRTCRSRDGNSQLIQTCHKITCVCGDNVNLEVTRVLENGNAKYLARYKCYRIHESCGFNIDAQDKKLCASYVAIVDRAKDFLYWITCEKCDCRQETHLSLQRVTVCASPTNKYNERFVLKMNYNYFMFVIGPHVHI
jgi:hypothetical protein